MSAAERSPDPVSVAIDVTPLLGARSGIGAAVAEIVRALGAIEHAPTLVPYTLSVRARRMKADVPPSTRFVPIPARVLLNSWTRFDAPRIDRWLRPAQVVHATNYLAPPSRMPTLVSVYDCSFVRYPELCTPEVQAFEPALRRAVARGVTLHTGSEFIAAEIDEVFGPGLRAAGRIVVVPLGVPPVDAVEENVSVDRVPDGAPFVLALGTLEPRKNLPHLVSAFGLLSAQHPELLLVIAGADGPARTAIDNAIARLADDEQVRVIITGAVTDAERRALLTRARVLAYPSIYEGFGFPVLEAMTANVPVVAARAGSIPEIAGDAARLIEPTDERDLAAALDTLLTDEEARAELIRRGQRRVQEFSWETTARGLAHCYNVLSASS